MTKFKTQENRDEQATVLKVTIGGPAGPMLLEKEAPDNNPGEKELGLKGRVEHVNGDGDLHDLARRMAAVYRRVTASNAGSHTLSQMERRAIRDTLVAAMLGEGVKDTPELRTIASLLAGLRDELPVESANDVKKSLDLKKSFNLTETVCPHCEKTTTLEIPGASQMRGLQNLRCPHCSKAWSEGDLRKMAGRTSNSQSPELRQVMIETREKLEILRERITKLLNDRIAAPAPSTRFKPDSMSKDAVAREELKKALANGKPAQFEGEGIKRTNFQTVESVAPGVRVESSTLPVATEVRKHSKFEPQQS